MSAPLTWRVIGVTSDSDGVTRALILGGFAAHCGHHHDTREEAEACLWEPELPAGSTYAGHRDRDSGRLTLAHVASRALLALWLELEAEAGR